MGFNSGFKGLIVGFRLVLIAAKSAYKLRHVRPSAHSMSASPIGQISVKFGTGHFYENLLRKSKLG